MNTATAVAKATQPDEAALQQRAQSWLDLVNEMTIETQADYDIALVEIRSIKSEWTSMESDRDSWVRPLNEQVKRLNGKFKPRLDLLEQAEKILKDKATGFLERENARIAKEKREAEERAEAERKRLEAEAEEARVKAQQEADRLLAEAGKGKKAAAAALQQAQQVIQAAEAKATVLEQTAAVTTALPAFSAPAVRKGAGISTPKTLSYEVEDMLALMRFIVEKRPDLVVLLDVVPAKMNAQVKLHGVKTDLPGVRVFEKTGLTVR